MTTTDPDAGSLGVTTRSRRAPADYLEVLPSWAFVAYGVLTALLGVALLIWPGATLLVAVAVLAAQLFITGIVQIARAVAVSELSGGGRTLLVIGGVLSLLVAALVLRRPLQTLVIVTLLIGAWWIVGGVLDLVDAITGERSGWAALRGVITFIAGMYVLLNPGLSLRTFVVVAGVVLIVQGGLFALAPLLRNRT